MEKVKVSKELFESLNKALEMTSALALINQHASKKESSTCWESSIFVSFNELSVFEMTEILLNGYELKENKLEIIKERIKEFKSDKIVFAEAYVDGALDMLDALNLKIEGINA